MLIVAGHLTVHRSDRDSFVADSAAAVESARSADGCLDFAVSADSVDPARINVLERWRDRDALAAFRENGPDDELANRIVDMRVEEFELAG